MSTIDCTPASAARKSPCPFTFSAYSPLPAEIPPDAKLTPFDRALYKAVKWFCGDKDYCWPCNRTLARWLGDRHPSSVRRSLLHLEKADLIGREPADNWAGRVIYLTGGARHPRAKARAHNSYVVVKEEKANNPPTPLQRQRPNSDPQSEPTPPVEAIPAPRQDPPAAAPEPVQAVPSAQVTEPPPAAPEPRGATLTDAEQACLEQMAKDYAKSHAKIVDWLASGDPVCVAEARSKLQTRPAPPPEPTTIMQVIDTLPTNPNAPMQLASWMAREWHDEDSLNNFLGIARQVQRQKIPLEAFRSAVEQGFNPKARVPGKVFQYAIRPFLRPP